VRGYTCWPHIAACLSNTVAYIACVPEVFLWVDFPFIDGV